MKIDKSNIFAGLLVLLLLGGGWTGYRVHVLSDEKEALLEEVAGLDHKIVQFKEKLAEQKSLAEQYIRIKTRLEGELRASEAQRAELEAKLSQDNTQLRAELELLKKSSREASAKYEMRLAEYKDALAQWKTQYEALRDESIARIRERDDKIATLTDDNYRLDSQLKGEIQEHNYCRRANARFADLSEELLDRYANKDVVDSLKSKEPLTQFDKIEMEKLVQDFQDAIDKNTLTTKNRPETPVVGQ